MGEIGRVMIGDMRARLSTHRVKLFYSLLLGGLCLVLSLAWPSGYEAKRETTDLFLWVAGFVAIVYPCLGAVYAGYGVKFERCLSTAEWVFEGGVPAPAVALGRALGILAELTLLMLASFPALAIAAAFEGYSWGVVAFTYGIIWLGILLFTGFGLAYDATVENEYEGSEYLIDAILFLVFAGIPFLRNAIPDIPRWALMVHPALALSFVVREPRMLGGPLAWMLMAGYFVAGLGILIYSLWYLGRKYRRNANGGK